MSTKAEQFRYRTERQGPGKASRVRARKDSPVDTSRPGVSATDRRVAVPKSRVSERRRIRRVRPR